MLLTVAVIGAAHALRGEVRLDIRTDDPQGRLAPGTVLPTDPVQVGPLTVTRLRRDGRRWLAAFEQAPDRTSAQALRGVRLLVDTDQEPDRGQGGSGHSEEGWYRHQLVGLRARRVDGTHLGEVVDLERGVAQDRLVVRTPEGSQVSVPFVEALVPVVDTASAVVVLDPPGGLFPEEGGTEAQ
ncbi:ribosome maturation factor RimM [Actinomyces sp. 2119]|uniref:ribosome maturation factor RimM n=1 Tax=Actinomyces sp. 2119 TaxID=2321393 RepID=UPI000E6B54A4|nr:ribosome maturation factor RimM [Actinomyces sp. 2119]RJF43099.1 ribosome maturation factor RimM [Actinomyces sp. 2119]